MSEEQNPSVPVPTNWLGVAKNINLPAFLLGPAGAAISRLVGGLTDIPAAWLQARVDEINATSEAQRIVKLGLANAAAASAVGQSELVDCALASMLPRHLQKQANREAVARKTLEELETADVQASEDVAEPDPDWMNVFGRYAEDATSDRLQTLWARVLSGQIRRPGRFSLSTLRFLSEIEMDIAKLLETIEGEIVLNSFMLISAKQRLPFNTFVELNHAGLLSEFVGSGLGRSFEADEDGDLLVGGDEPTEESLGLYVRGDPGQKFRMDVIGLTKIGRQVSVLLPRTTTPEEKLERLGKVFADAGAKAVDLIRENGRAVQMDEMIVVKELWRAE